MAISVPVILSSGGTDVDATTFTTASMSFVAGHTYIGGILLHNTGAVPTNPVVSGATSGTWVAQSGNTFSTIAAARKRIVSRTFVATSSFSETILIDPSAGGTHHGCQWIFLDVTGVQGTSTTCVLQAATAARVDSPATALSTTFPGAFTPNSITICFVANSVTTPAVVDVGGYTLLAPNQTGAAPTGAIVATYKMTSGNPSYTFSASAASLAAIELNPAPAGGLPLNFFTRDI